MLLATPLAIVLAFGGMCLVGLGAYRLRVRHLRARQRELVRLVEKRTRSLREEKDRTDAALREAEEARREAERQKEIAQYAVNVIEEQAERLRELDRIKTRFFNNVSHEFRTPLDLTIGPLENALTGVYGPLGPELRAQLELMLRNARRLLRLINQLLDLSKLESSRMRLYPRRDDLVPVVEGVVLSFTPFAERKSLQLTFETEPSRVELDFDHECLEKIFFNLLSNAVKFTPEHGRVDVTVREREQTAGAAVDEGIEIRVRDNGIGIPANELPHIFDRFHQVDGAVSHMQEGTGIGLSLVRELVSLHGGTIEVSSEPGVGTEFVVTLPRSLPHVPSFERERGPSGGRPEVTRGPLVEMAVFDEDDEPAPRRPERPQARSAGDGADDAPRHPAAPRPRRTPAPPRPPERATLLVVDDNPDVLAYVSHRLRDAYEIVTARDGRDALEQARRLRPSLIISDVMMPLMDGYALCRALKEDPDLRAIPVILLTARASQDDRIEGLQAGSDDYLSKPFSTTELLARINNLLTLRRQRQELESLNAELADTNDALRQADEMKTQLLHVVAHDMKNPLNAIREFARLLRHDVGEEPEVMDALDLIHRSSDQMLRLVDTLLESAALEAGRPALHLEPVAAGELAQGVVERNRVQAERKAQTLHYAASADRFLVEADRDRLRDAMDNLVNNAIKFSPHGKPIHVSVALRGEHVHFSVADEGPGLTEDDRARLFGRFQRLSARPTGDESSSGLGLSIVKQIAELHGGRVWAESEPGRGSTFVLELPLYREALIPS